MQTGSAHVEFTSLGNKCRVVRPTAYALSWVVFIRQTDRSWFILALYCLRYTKFSMLVLAKAENELFIFQNWLLKVVNSSEFCLFVDVRKINVQIQIYWPRLTFVSFLVSLNLLLLWWLWFGRWSSIWTSKRFWFSDVKSMQFHLILQILEVRSIWENI